MDEQQVIDRLIGRICEIVGNNEEIRIILEDVGLSEKEIEEWLDN